MEIRWLIYSPQECLSWDACKGLSISYWRTEKESACLRAVTDLRAPRLPRSDLLQAEQVLRAKCISVPWSSLGSWLSGKVTHYAFIFTFVLILQWWQFKKHRGKKLLKQKTDETMKEKQCSKYAKLFLLHPISSEEMTDAMWLTYDKYWASLLMSTDNLMRWYQEERKETGYEKL